MCSPALNALVVNRPSPASTISTLNPVRACFRRGVFKDERRTSTPSSGCLISVSWSLFPVKVARLAEALAVGGECACCARAVFPSRPARAAHMLRSPGPSRSREISVIGLAVRSQCARVYVCGCGCGCVGFSLSLCASLSRKSPALGTPTLCSPPRSRHR